MNDPTEFDIPVGAPSRAGKPINLMMILGLAAVVVLVLGALVYSASPYVSSSAIDAEEIPGVSAPE